mmetsp:Transcript_75592/g.202379  ORF Transcript_75592/g.202379 Transcript_75592/m.202379 type:complete len:122 (+) Transcript_75592:132-497(+)
MHKVRIAKQSCTPRLPMHRHSSQQASSLHKIQTQVHNEGAPGRRSASNVVSLSIVPTAGEFHKSWSEVAAGSHASRYASFPGPGCRTTCLLEAMPSQEPKASIVINEVVNSCALEIKSNMI